MEKFALILGSSSGFGLATAKYLAGKGYGIYGVHFDRRSALIELEPQLEEMRKTAPSVQYFNINAADENKRNAALDEIKEKIGNGKIEILMHSLAFGTLKPMFSGEKKLSQKDLDMTLNVMGHSLIYWTQGLVERDLLADGAHVVAMTSEGNRRVWQSYGAVSAAKVVLESVVRQITVELAPKGIRANALQAGVTVTPALKKIPGSDQMVAEAEGRNPFGRLTSPEDVAKAIWLLSQPEAAFITGNVICCDGGESIC